jgi:hypothetical protein
MDVLQLRSSKQNEADLFDSAAFIYVPFQQMTHQLLSGEKAVFATHPFNHIDRYKTTSRFPWDLTHRW